MIDDPWIPPDMEIPRRGAVPVRFFGTYNFTWIESQRNLMPFDLGRQEDMASNGDLKVKQSTCPCASLMYRLRKASIGGGAQRQAAQL
jgi:hypothetical protein